MRELPERYDRNVGLFGRLGQRKLRRMNVVLVGTSGLGSPLAQQLALLGVRRVAVIDPEELDNTNRNRFIGARESDPVPGSAKVALVERMIREVNAAVTVVPLQRDVIDPESFEQIKAADWVFGCLDEDGPRFVLNELCAAYGLPYFDLASEIHEDGSFGGRLCLTRDATGCLHCLGELDMDDVRRWLTSEEERLAIDRLYGVPQAILGTSGPSVAPLNAIVAGHAAMEFMVAVTGVRRPERLIRYRGDRPVTTTSTDRRTGSCYYCQDIRGIRADADVERYLRIGHLRRGKRS